MNYKIYHILFIILLFVACNAKQKESSLDNSKFSKSNLEKTRKEIKSFFLYSDQSPIAKLENKDKFLFDFYSANSNLFVKAKLIEFPKKDTVTILTSKENKSRKYLKYGYFEFRINDKTYKLTSYLIPEHQESLFLPFLDETNGNGTYEAGRYLDIEFRKDNNYYIDFNLAYSPYCAYNKKYSCPLVPKENFLKTKIEAGEKLHSFAKE
ncbi:MAG: DUF1684 domain-containing protein [Candidatus Kapabacteria bacterium]|nr:DUF1684 domain-containing protein [Candidatus Kapabacteria bacterium]